MADIALIGGHGKVALLAAPLLVAAGHRVHSVVRNPDHVEAVRATGARAEVADVENYDAHQLAVLLRGRDTVVWSAGAGGGNPSRTYALDRDAAIRTMDAAQAAGARRFVMVSYFGAGPGHGVHPENGFYAYAQAKSAADAHLCMTTLDWTILRPSGLTEDDATGMISVGRQQTPGTVSRADVAAVIVASVADRHTIGRIYEFNSGSVPITQALLSPR